MKVLLRVFNDKGEFVELEYNGQIQEYQDKRKDGQLNILKFKDEEMSTKAFEFFAENSNVEWGQVKAEHRSYVMTNESRISVSASSYASLLIESNMKVKEVNHSNPVQEIGVETPSGYGHNPTANNMYSEPNPYRIEGDYHSMRLLIDGGEVNGVKLKGFGDKAKAINFRVFNPVSKTYIKYDENKAVKQQ